MGSRVMETAVLVSETTVVVLSMLSLYYMIRVGTSTRCYHALPLLTLCFSLVVAEAVQASLLIIGPFITNDKTLARLWLVPSIMHLALLPLFFPCLAGFLALLSSTLKPRACLRLDVFVPRTTRALRAFSVLGFLLSATALTALGLSVPIIDESLTRPVVMFEAKPGMVAVTLCRLLPIIAAAMYLVMASLLLSIMWRRVAVGVAAVLCFISNFIHSPLGIYIISPYFEITVLVALVREIAYLYSETTKSPFKNTTASSPSRSKEYNPAAESKDGVSAGAGGQAVGGSPSKMKGYGSFNPYQRLPEGPISPGLDED